MTKEFEIKMDEKGRPSISETIDGKNAKELPWNIVSANTLKYFQEECDRLNLSGDDMHSAMVSIASNYVLSYVVRFGHVDTPPFIAKFFHAIGVNYNQAIQIFDSMKEKGEPNA